MPKGRTVRQGGLMPAISRGYSEGLFGQAEGSRNVRKDTSMIRYVSLASEGFNLSVLTMRSVLLAKYIKCLGKLLFHIDNLGQIVQPLR
jgi:hypothetical protein